MKIKESPMAQFSARSWALQILNYDTYGALALSCTRHLFGDFQLEQAEQVRYSVLPIPCRHASRQNKTFLHNLARQRGEVLR